MNEYKKFLSKCYEEANQEIDDAFEITAGDGLDDEEENDDELDSGSTNLW
jgi:hypothetical protein